LRLRVYGGSFDQEAGWSMTANLIRWFQVFCAIVTVILSIPILALAAVRSRMPTINQI
jgi:hypothetical protein